MHIRGTYQRPSGSMPLELPAGASRRMAKIQRATCEKAYAALNKTGVENLHGVYAATALGCLEDTEKFLEEITGPSTSLRSPLPFMRSTHNTMAGQLALLLKVHGPNLTFSQEIFGFHAALLHAMLHVEEHPDHALIALAADENTELTKQLVNTLQRKGQLGEGVEVFVLGGNKREGDVARIALIQQGAVSDMARWQALFNNSVIDHFYWSATPGSTLAFELPNNSKALRYDERSGHHGAQTAQALAMVIAEMEQKKITGPCMIIDQLGDQLGAILVEPC